MQVHEFRRSLANSHAASDLPIWDEVYRNAFGEQYVARIDHRQDGEHQRAGIDVSIILANSKQLLIDEKARDPKPWVLDLVREKPDVMLEFAHVGPRYNDIGWVCKPLRADYIAYATIPLGTCYLLPVLQTQKAWVKHGEDWKRQFGIKKSPNRGYDSLNVPVPVPVLFGAIGKCLRVGFEPPT